MRYFTKEIIDRINSGNAHEREEGEKQWNDNACVYNQYFLTIRRQLPRTFLNAWEDYSGFHDCEVKQVLFFEQSKRLQLELKKREAVLLLNFFRCKNMRQIEVPSVRDVLLYIELYDNKGYEIHLLFSSELEMVVRCETIDVIIP